jgi:hypothetical protein
MEQRVLQASGRDVSQFSGYSCCPSEWLTFWKPVLTCFSFHRLFLSRTFPSAQCLSGPCSSRLLDSSSTDSPITFYCPISWPTCLHLRVSQLRLGLEDKMSAWSMSSKVSCYEFWALKLEAVSSSLLPNFIQNQITDGSEVVSLTRRLLFTRRKTPCTHIC